MSGLKVSARADIAPFFVMEMMRAAADREASGGDVVHMEVGQPSTPASAGARSSIKMRICGGGRRSSRARSRPSAGVTHT